MAFDAVILQKRPNLLMVTCGRFSSQGGLLQHETSQQNCDQPI
jgi:hypothetical protein